MNATFEPMLAATMWSAFGAAFASSFIAAIVAGLVVRYRIAARLKKAGKQTPASPSSPPPSASAPAAAPTHCPQCGTALPGGTLGQLCPACLLKAGAAADTVTDAKQPGFQPPGLAELAPLFPQLEILELVGRGGMGAVYKARQKELDRVVALKILPPGSGGDPAFAERFAREARALAKLNHPGIVTLYEFGRVEGLYFFLMEFVDGVNLRQLLHAGRLATREALAIVPQICDALQYAHDQGIVHRDIKPENILLDRRGRVKVADFGLAKIIAPDHPDENPGDKTPSTSPATENLTDAGKVMGTPPYMSPEQRENPGEVDHRADIYALGVVFYQMLTGELPGARLEPPSRKVHIDVRLDEIVLRALERKPELRYQQASILKTQVETIAETPAPGAGQGSETQTQTSQGQPAAVPANSEARFSRLAIAGVICAGLSLAPLIWAMSILTGGDSFYSASPGKNLLNFVAFSSVASVLPLTATILGWLAVFQIRRATGRLFGLKLAVFDGLLFPLLLLNSVILTFWLFLFKLFNVFVLRHANDNLFHNLGDMAIRMTLVLLCLIWVNWKIIQRVWQAINHEDQTGKINQHHPASVPSHSKAHFSFRWPLRLAAIVFLAAALLAVADAIIAPRMYSATARVKVTCLTLESEDPLTFKQSYSSPFGNEIRPWGERTLILSDPVLQPVITSLGLAERWGKKYNHGTPLSSDDILRLFFRKNLAVDFVQNTLLMDITYSSSNPEEAAEIANALAKSYQTYNEQKLQQFAQSKKQQGISQDGQVYPGYQIVREPPVFQQVQIMNTAQPPRSPVRPKVPLIIFTGMIIGLISGAIVFVLSVFFLLFRCLLARLRAAEIHREPDTGKQTAGRARGWDIALWSVSGVFLLALLVMITCFVIAVSWASYKHKNPSPAQTLSVPRPPVPQASAETWSPTVMPGEKIEPQKILDEAKKLMEAGQYEEALQRQIWFFNHALQYDSSLTGTRWVSCLSQWAELGRRYPKAKAALLEIRDEGTRRLASGNGYSDLFTDVIFINRALQDEDANYTLFKTLLQKDPQVARQGFIWVRDLLVARGEYSLTYDLMGGNSQAAFDELRRRYEMEAAWNQRMIESNARMEQHMAEFNRQNGISNVPPRLPDTANRMFNSAKDSFVNGVRQLIEIVIGAGHPDQAGPIQTQALAVMDDPRLRSAISDAEKKTGKSTDNEIARLKRRAAEETLQNTKQRVDVGLAPPSEYEQAKSDRDIAAAELAGNTVEVARLKWQSAKLKLENIAKLNSIGRATPDEVQKAKLASDIAEAEYRQLAGLSPAAENPSPSPSGQPPSGAAKLQFLAWQDEWQTNQPGAARHPDGSAVTNAEELQALQWLKTITGFHLDNKLHPEQRTLFLGFSHPDLSRDMGQITLLDVQGNPIKLGEAGIAGTSQPPNKNNGNLGWQFLALSPGEGTNYPPSLTVRLRYTLGALEHLHNVAPDYVGALALEGGSKLNSVGSVGENGSGRAFVVMTINANLRWFGVEAVTKDGRRLMSTGNRTSQDDSGFMSAIFNFDVPLTNVEKFVIGSRPVFTTEWKNVVLPK